MLKELSSLYIGEFKTTEQFQKFVEDMLVLHSTLRRSPRYTPARPLCSFPEPSHRFEEFWSFEWELFSLPSALDSWDCLRFHPRPNSALKRGADVFQSESQKKPQMSPGEVDKDKDSNVEVPDQPSTSLLSIWKKGQELETCDAGDYPDPDPASDHPRCLSCWPWLQRAFGRKRKTKRISGDLMPAKTCN
uniref:Uncharacterized protein n=1 Tax=Peromyscus maniculatus bairdii TaxID=230844 RepID=A0A8C8UPY9_PERMB